MRVIHNEDKEQLFPIDSGQVLVSLDSFDIDLIRDSLAFLRDKLFKDVVSSTSVYYVQSLLETVCHLQSLLIQFNECFKVLF
ncbi:MAG: hypothetical protein K2N49_00150 [Ruminococcus sp.]|nr:hypothetical protein [Ruminococcus sp.]MDE5763531.1 hypothetical protein [Ruminococcus sp.]MDE7225270.1 hypothetical protein [Ruminococcus sp.]